MPVGVHILLDHGPDAVCDKNTPGTSALPRNPLPALFMTEETGEANNKYVRNNRENQVQLFQTEI